MGPRGRTRQEIIDLLGRAAEQAQHAEAYHAAADDPGTLEGRAAQQAACDAAAMQLIELAGCTEGFIRGRGDPGTTLARFDDALEPVIQMRTAHTHPERVFTPPPITPGRLDGMIKELRRSIGNLDEETLKIQPRGQVQALSGIFFGLERIERDGLPNAAALRARDLHYAGYYHEIQFGRLAKATGLYVSWNSQDARHVDVNSSIFDADDMAHKFHVMRGEADKSILPVSVVAPGHPKRVPGRLLSGIIRELRNELQKPAERLAEFEMSATAKVREEHGAAVQGLAQQYAGMTGDPEAATLIHDYVQRQEPPLDREIIEAMRKALQVAAGSGGGYLAVPEAVRNRCLELCFALEKQDDTRLIKILDAAEGRSGVGGRDKDPNAPEERTHDAAGQETNVAERERGRQIGVQEKDPYLAAMLAAGETELSQAGQKPEGEALREGTRKRGRSL